MAAPVGIVANPASGKDIRRLVAYASVFDNGEKRNILRRVFLGAMAAGAGDFFFMPDANALVEAAADGLEIEGSLEPVDTPRTASMRDSECAAAVMRQKGCAVIVTLGGDGTNRAVVRGWRDAPLIAISTGTNNVFPAALEGTIAGAAAGLLATGLVRLDEVAVQAKAIHIVIDGEPDDIALVDAVLTDERWLGSRALWHAERIKSVLLTRAEPAAVGMAAVGGLLHPVDTADEHGLFVELGDTGTRLVAPIIPGSYAEVGVAAVRPVPLGETVELVGPGLLAFDGERERQLRPRQRASLTIRRDGPWVVDVPRTLRLAACRGAFIRSGGANGD